MYQNGQGVDRNPALAVQWWHRAAEQGNTSSQYNLGVAYNNGEGVAQDFVEARKWAEIAVAYSAGDSQRKFAALRDALGRKMTPDDVANAQKRARDWIETFERRVK
jgi:TPR repeat protein